MFVATVAVGTLLIFSFNSYAVTLRHVPEKEQLNNLLSHIAAKAVEIMTMTSEDSTTKVYLDLPTSIGDRQYWIRLRNDSIQAWVEGGLGEIWNGTTVNKVFLPSTPIAAGEFIGDFGVATLTCRRSGSELELVLATGRVE
jgi:hypothetical protein